MDPAITNMSGTADGNTIDESNAARSSIDQVFSLNEYVRDNDAEEDDHQHVQQQANGASEYDNDSSLQMLDLEHDDTASSPGTSSPNKEGEEQKGSSSIRLVEYNHGDKPKKFGRRRAPQGDGTSLTGGTLQGDSMENSEKSKFMLYRLDDLPVGGPGSRGGKPDARVQQGKLTSETLRKKKQAQLTFGNNGLGLKKDLEAEQQSDSDTSNAVPETDESVSNGSDSKKTTTNDEPKDSEGPKKGTSTPATEKKKEKSVTLKIPLVKKTATPPKKTDPKRKPKAASTEPVALPTSRTTVLNNVNKLTRQFPGPVIPLCYDLYDDNLINKHDDAKEEGIALGYDVKPAPYAGDIIFLISFCSRFRDVIGLGKFGPQDIEEGLGLDDLADPRPVSKLMNALFAKLVTLVLNRKPEVNPRLQGKAISELKAVCTTLGLPREWKDKNEVYRKVKISEANMEPVDESKPEILLDEGYVFHPPFVYENPFNDKLGFEKNGFPSIASPLDRLIMLRTLAQWCLSASNDIRGALNVSVQKQDVPGDKETYYASRAILKGFKHTEDLTNEINNKIAKKKYSEDNDSVARYVEPISDPTQHSLRFRLEDMVVGDVGFHVGRFYFCRISDSKDGGLSSIAQMKQAWANPGITRASYACRFKLYVQDVHQMLVDRLAAEGVEFNAQGEEVEPPAATEEYPDFKFYEVASNSEELDGFVAHLETRLGLRGEDKAVKVLTSGSPLYKQVQSLYEFLSAILPLVRQQSDMVLEERSSRKRTVDYSDIRASKKTKVEEEEDISDHDFEDDLDEDIPAEQDDEEDDDYMD